MDDVESVQRVLMLRICEPAAVGGGGLPEGRADEEEAQRHTSPKRELKTWCETTRACIRPGSSMNPGLGT